MHPNPGFSYERPIVKDVMRGMAMGKRVMHMITGPRQVGKTTAALQIADKWRGPVLHASADSPLPPGPEWILAQWERAVRDANGSHGEEVLLILDEVQKVSGWSETIKALWDQTCREGTRIQALILGSSSLLIQKGLSESLAGRFFLHRCTHWDYGEMERAFSWELDKWIYFGGYPGAATMIEQEDMWSRYITDALIETVLAKDVLQLQTVNKPALLRHLFLLASGYPAQIMSYNKMLGQLQDAGNTTTLAHYLRLLESAYLITGLELFKKGKRAKRGSSPKLIIWNNAIVNALSGDSFNQALNDYSWWGRLTENAIGAHLLNHLAGLPYAVYYWRQKGWEVDFVIQSRKKLWAIEVKSGRRSNQRGLARFCEHYPDARPLIVGQGGMGVEEFLRTDPKALLD